MTTKAQYMTQARAANPQPQHATINGEAVALTDAEYEASIEAWAAMRVEQDAAETKAQAVLATKRSAYKKLGLTDEEIDALIGV